jgi:hypothetical protein
MPNNPANSVPIEGWFVIMALLFFGTWVLWMMSRTPGDTEIPVKHRSDNGLNAGTTADGGSRGADQTPRRDQPQTQAHAGHWAKQEAAQPSRWIVETQHHGSQARHDAAARGLFGGFDTSGLGENENQEVKRG